MKLSIVIPAYNAANHIEKCISSLEYQDISKSEYEIIVTNDGSLDTSGQIVEKLQEEFSNIVLLNQENQGVSMARNSAITIAKGKYILPIDADDYVKENSLGEIFSIVDNYDSDCYVLQVNKIDENGQLIWKTDYKKYDKIVHQTLASFHDSKGENIRLADPDRSWAIVYKKEIMLKYDIFYPKNVPYLEDAIFVSKYFFYAKSYMLINTPFYMRTVRTGSAVNSDLFFTDFARKGFANGSNEIYNFYNTHKNAKVNEDRKGFLRQTYIHFCILPLISMVNSSNIGNVIKYVSDNSLSCKNIQIKATRYPFNLYGWTLYKNPYLFIFFYFFYIRFVQIKNKL
jgi:glycosyltransferase involved in cell wall biosynthesis